MSERDGRITQEILEKLKFDSFINGVLVGAFGIIVLDVIVYLIWLN